MASLIRNWQLAKAFFITGTDTDSGKTLVATGLLAAAKARGLSTAGIKPVSAGGENTPEGLRHEDALALQAQTTLSISYEQINPVALAAEVAPHIAAAEEGRRLSANRLVGFCRGVLMQRPDFAVIEGAGGWRVPLNDRETLADVARELKLPVILVVGMKLGCLNHALLTAEAIQRDGLALAGWVANANVPEMSRYQENVETLKRRLPCPLLGEVPYLAEANAENLIDYLNIELLLN